MLNVKAEQRILGHLHGTSAVVLVLAQEQEVLPELVFSEGGRVALEMFSQLTDIPDVLFLGRLTEIFKLDVLLELGDRRIVCYMHRPGGCSRVRATSRLIDQPMNEALPSSCRAMAQFNQPRQPTPGERLFCIRASLARRGCAIH